ncbi:MAG: hypothetical protein A3H98_02585 [Bacteroidetes bacterium RIFCSPLOWO2_02_FULL_36_8]|nr:MAG: hypothetical protein A3H98_02585 [Bacteroidetes bacterium RIFCSPLOWO2_02_FULL_36_8]OFY71007.1 MAG: hypothetical protein A3G23_12905 [Bacteroidetes bacterium RIFCSPLOWO2_12_FULL_37_12]
MKKKINILLAAPPEWLGGGIASAVLGIRAALLCLSAEITVREMVYVKPKGKLLGINKFILEIYDLFAFVVKIIIFKMDVVHIQSTFHYKNINVLRDSIYLWATRLTGKKFILHAHGGEWDKVNEWSKGWQYYIKLYLTSCNRIIVTSSNEQQVLEYIYKDKVKVSTIYNPVVSPIPIPAQLDFSKFQPIKKIIFASRLIEEKGVLDVVHATSHLMHRNDFHVLIYGKGILFNKAQSLISSLNLQDKITLKSEVSLPQLIEQYLQCDMFLFPSYYGEGFPMALFYAVSCGLPIITTKIRAVSDFLSEPENCLWVEPKNPRILAEKIGFLLDHPDLVTPMRKNNKKLSLSFSPEKISHEFLTLYQKLISQ